MHCHLCSSLSVVESIVVDAVIYEEHASGEIICLTKYCQTPWNKRIRHNMTIKLINQVIMDCTGILNPLLMIYWKSINMYIRENRAYSSSLCRWDMGKCVLTQLLTWMEADQWHYWLPYFIVNISTCLYSSEISVRVKTLNTSPPLSLNNGSMINILLTWESVHHHDLNLEIFWQNLNLDCSSPGILALYPPASSSSLSLRSSVRSSSLLYYDHHHDHHHHLQ